MDSVVDLVGKSPRRLTVCPFDAEPVAQFVYGVSGLVSGDEFPDLVGAGLACPSSLGRWSGAGSDQLRRMLAHFAVAPQRSALGVLGYPGC